MRLPTRLREPPSPPPCRLHTNPASNLLSLNRPNNFLPYSAESISRISLHSNGFRPSSHARQSKLTEIEADTNQETDFDKLKRKVEALGVKFDSCTPGQYDLLYCPKCKGGQQIQSLSFHISQHWSYAMWRCFNLNCGWAGQVFADNRSSWTLNGESLRLEPLCDELLAYFSERMISKETLDRNNVMQVTGGKTLIKNTKTFYRVNVRQEKVIAFPYRQDGLLVGCKYRTVEKKFWQGKNTEKTLYGVDDIAEADDIIIVEGEIDKLSVEEAGYRNCVSVPGGAPQIVSLKELPSPEKDTSFQYIWNCRDYLDKASRIILATDGDIPGQALAEELARRVGKERCWLVEWPKKDEASLFKDANEVLKNLGADALRHAIDKAKSYQMLNVD